MTRKTSNSAVIRAALESLCKRRPIFHSEADFQHELACELSQAGFSRVRVECRMEGIRVDILADNVAIELKYAPRNFSREWNGEKFAFSRIEHDEKDIHGLRKDVERLDGLIKSGAIENGFVVLLTNRKRLREKLHGEWHNFGEEGDFRYTLLDVREFCAGT